MKHWVKLKGDASNNSLVWDIVESITEVLEDMGIDVEEQWEAGECKLVFTKRAADGGGA